MSIHMAIQVSTHRSRDMSRHMSIRTSVHTSMRMSIRMSMHMSTHGDALAVAEVRTACGREDGAAVCRMDMCIDTRNRHVHRHV